MFHARYWDSSFFGHAKHSHDYKDVELKKLYQIFMDRPEINVKFYKEIPRG